MPYYIWVIIFSILMVPGVIGIILPMLPSIPYMFIVALIFGIVDKFYHLSVLELIVLGFLALVSFTIDYASGILGAKYGGASKQAIIFGALGFIFGLIFFPPLGGIAGMFIGVFTAEIFRHADQKKAFKAATGSLAGSLTGILINLVLALLFFTLFLLFVL